MDFYRYLLLGLATSVHCIAMCGSLVMTYTVKSESSGGLVRRLAPHLTYQAAKIVSYMTVAVVLGALASAVGSAFDISGLRNWIMVAAGAFMILLGLSMTGYFPWLRKLTPRPPAFLVRLISANRRRAISDASDGRVSWATPLTFGLLTGLMPCAPLIAAQAGAMSLASPAKGAFLMLGFGLGTAPLMIALGLVSGWLSATFRTRLQYVAAAAVVLFGLVILNRGLMLVGSPVTFDSVRQAVIATGSSGSNGSSTTSDTAEVGIVIENVRFVPETVSVPADRPVRLIVDRRENDSCSDQLAIPQLGVLVDLKPFAKTAVELPATKAGTYTLTCGMGMMSGRIVFGQPGTAGGSLVPLVVAAALLAVLAGAAVLGLRRAARATAEPDGREAAGPAGGSRALLGFTPLEAIIVAVAIVVAVAAGLYLGGMLRL